MWASGGLELEKTWCVWRAVQDLIRDQLWQALNVSQRNLDRSKNIFGTLRTETCNAVLLGLHVEKKKKIHKKIFLETFEVSLITLPVIINS